jgi:hypothetical protein
VVRVVKAGVRHFAPLQRARELDVRHQIVTISYYPESVNDAGAASRRQRSGAPY